MRKLRQKSGVRKQNLESLTEDAVPTLRLSGFA